eukprot:4623665-Pyramimonas_sp.AAC.1
MHGGPAHARRSGGRYVREPLERVDIGRLVSVEVDLGRAAVEVVLRRHGVHNLALEDGLPMLDQLLQSLSRPRHSPRSRLHTGER